MLRRTLTFVLLLVVLSGKSGALDLPANTNAGSFKFIQAAAIKGHPRAAYHLATYYYHGIGTPEDKELAVYWFRKAADAGIADAELAYGLLLLSGEGVPVDKAAALEWIGKAARQEHEKARQVLQELLTYRGDVKNDLPDKRQKRSAETATRDSLRIEGKGLLLDQGTFGLKFSLPPLSDQLALPSQQPPTLNQMKERLQGGTFDIIIRPPQK